MQCECGRYAYLVTTLPDGTDIYHCSECGKLWGERLVRFQVCFQLTEMTGDGRNGQDEAVPELAPVAEAR